MLHLYIFFVKNIYFQARSCSSGKQRRLRFPSAFADKEIVPKMPLLAEEKLGSSGKPRSPSPPVRRSLSTDRGALIKSRIKLDPADDQQPIMKLQFPARIAMNKSFATSPSTTENSSKGSTAPQEPPKQDNISDVFYSLQRINSRKVHPEHEEEQFKHALNVRQGGVRKNKPENKAKAKHQMPIKTQKSEVAPASLSDTDSSGGKMEEARKSDFSETENVHALVGPTLQSALKVKKLHHFSRNFQNLEPRFGKNLLTFVE